MKPLLSIIIPHKNIPQLLERCLKSIPMRDDFEVIVVDDNSDASIVDFSKFPSISGWDYSHFKTIFLKESKNAGGARNEALKIAQGKWVVFADADDFFTADFIKAVDKYKDSEYDIVLFPINQVDSNTLQYINRDSWFNELVYNKRLTYREKVVGACVPWSKIIRRSVIEKNHILFENVRYANDVMFNTKVGLNATKCFVDDSLIIYNLTIRANSLTRILTKDAFRTRLDVDIRKFELLKSHHVLNTQNIPKRYILWSENFGFIELFRTIWLLFKSGILSDKNSAYNITFQNSTTYCISIAILNILKSKLFNKPK